MNDQPNRPTAWAIPPTISEPAQAALSATLSAPHPPAPPLDDRGAWDALIGSMREGVRAHLGAIATDAATNVSAAVVHAEDGPEVPVFVCLPGTDEVTAYGAPAPLVVLYLHGGGFVLGGGEACRLMGASTAARVGLLTYAVDYRLAPEHSHPAALDDCTAVYRWLLEQNPGERVVVVGHSAGAALAAALMLRVRDEGLPVPAAAVLLSPEADLTEQGDSFELMGRVGFLSAFIQMYADGADLRSPYLSPLTGDLGGLPPTLLQTGTRDVFLSNTVRLHRALRKAGVDARLHVWEAMPHAGFKGDTPEDDEVYAEVRAFLDDLVNTAADL